MNTIIRKIKGFKLRRQLKKCQFKKISLKDQYDDLCELIMDGIIKGDKQSKISKLQLERDFVHQDILKVMDDEWKIKRQLIGA
jgi:hypothetical protein